MGDLYVGMLILGVASAGLFGVTQRSSQTFSNWFCNTLAALVLVAAAIYSQAVWQRVELAEFLPFSSLIVVSNWFPLLAAVVGGLAWNRVPGGVARKSVSCLALSGTAWLAVVFPLLGEPPRCGDRWSRDGFCLQTTESTCTPACAASLLRTRGIEATEQEMAELCVTRTGTTWQGLYRGLKLKTRDTAWDVRVVHGDIGQLLNAADSPMIVSVGLEKHADVDGSYEREFGWTPGMRHSVLLLRNFSPLEVDIVDPNPEIGLERWSRADLELLYRGPAIQLVARR